MRNYSLEEVCIKITDGSHFSPKDVGCGYPMLSVKDMTEYDFNRTACKYVSCEDFEKLKKQDCVPKKNDILVAKDGSYLKHIFVCEEEKEEGILSSIAIFRPNTAIVEPKYLMYLLKSPQVFNDVKNNYVSGSALPRIVLKDFKKVIFNIPTLEQQKKVVGVLSSIDKKIRLNKEINNNLLEQALSLYATYFAESDKNGCIGDYCIIKSGFAFKSSWWKENGVKVIKIGSINQDNLNLAECSYVDADKINKAKDFKVKAGDLLIAMTGATIGKFAMVPYCAETLLVNQRVGKFFLGDNPIEKLPFIYCTLKQPDVYYEIVNRGQGSAQPNISASDIMNIPCVIPTTNVINTFNDIIQPLFDLIISNQQENQRLSKFRDTLLPKLMSGELDVSTVEF